MMEYKGYIGKVEFDDEADILHGEVINLRDVITFQAESVQELRQAFQESVDDYLEFCAERNEAPERPFSGKFTMRISPELHRRIFTQAKMSGKSLNKWATEVFEQSVSTTNGTPQTQ
ncbi:MAG: type II toxin-antitoxin system HicB family antitoxin [Chloroflexi bacterium]|nr:type II toxin-antitoxin system HicB family antitoxin [Chloroflexota bacterium]